MNEPNVMKSAWDEADSTEFLDLGHYFVPARESQIDTMCRLAGSAPAGDFVELCCGPGLLSQALLQRFPERRVHAFEGSPKMIEAAATLLGPCGERFEALPFNLADRSWRRLPWPVAGVVSSLAVHHLDGTQKQELFTDLADTLLPGGVLAIADIVRPAGSAGVALAAADWDEAVRQRSLRLDGDLRAYDKFRKLRWNYFEDPDGDPSDKPSPLFDQLRWLEAAGFGEVDVYWMWGGHAIYGGRKS
jgi:SAM-dependent methyltransferase